MVGRVWPRHGHRGRPLNSVVRPHPSAIAMSTQSSKSSLFGKIETREAALKTLRDAAYVCFFLAALMLIFVFVFHQTSAVVDAVIYLVLGALLHFLRSRVAAVVFALVSLGSLGVTVANMAGASLPGGRNIILAVIVVFASVRAVEASFKLHGRFKGSSDAV